VTARWCPGAARRRRAGGAWPVRDDLIGLDVQVAQDIEDATHTAWTLLTIGSVAQMILLIAVCR